MTKFNQNSAPSRRGIIKGAAALAAGVAAPAILNIRSAYVKTTMGPSFKVI